MTDEELNNVMDMAKIAGPLNVVPFLVMSREILLTLREINETLESINKSIDENTKEICSSIRNN
jgi:hypothetical protein